MWQRCLLNIGGKIWKKIHIVWALILIGGFFIFPNTLLGSKSKEKTKANVLKILVPKSTVNDNAKLIHFDNAKLIHLISSPSNKMIIKVNSFFLSTTIKVTLAPAFAWVTEGAPGATVVTQAKVGASKIHESPWTAFLFREEKESIRLRVFSKRYSRLLLPKQRSLHWSRMPE